MTLPPKYSGRSNLIFPDMVNVESILCAWFEGTYKGNLCNQMVTGDVRETLAGNVCLNLYLIWGFSASFDRKVKIWDPETGKCIHSLEKHTQPVYSISFSPDGRYIASGSFDMRCLVWNVKDGSLVKTFLGSSGIYDVSFSPTGDQLAVCFADHTVNICVVVWRAHNVAYF